MLNKYQFIKKLANTKSFLCSFQSLLSHKYPFLQTINLYKISNPSFSTSHIRDEIDHLQLLSNEQKDKMTNILEKYALSKEDLTQLTTDEVKWMNGVINDLGDSSRTYLQKGDRPQAYEYLTKMDYIFEKLGIKDTFDVASNDFQKASILVSQQKLQEAEKCLNEVDRICNLLSEDPQAKSLRVQSWYLLAQISSQSSQDKALELYRAILRNIDDVNESALSMLLPSVHEEMGEIYLSRGETENMVKSWENTLQAVIKYFVGENSTVDFSFLGDIANSPALRDLKIKAESAALKNALESFSDPFEKVGVICCMLGNIYLVNKNFRQAMNLYDKAFKIFDKLPRDYSSLLYDVYFSMSLAQRYLPDSTLAAYFLKKAKETIASAEQNLTVAATYCRWARVFSNQLDPFGTEDYYKKALELYKTLDPSNKAKIFSIYEEWGEVVRTLYWGLPMDEEIGLEQAVEIWKQAEKYLNLADHHAAQKVYLNLEFLYYDLGNYEESERYLKKALQSCEDTGNTLYAFSNYYNAGEYLEKQLNWKEAFECYGIAARVYEKEAKKDPEKVQNLAAKISQIKEKLQATK